MSSYLKFPELTGNAGPTAIWQHECPHVGARTDEHQQSFIRCRCFEGKAFLSAQDAIAVKLDLERGASS